MKEEISSELNGKPVSLDVDGERDLLWVLRIDLEMTGVKYGCGQGLWGGTRAIRHPLYALDTLYEGLDISSGIDARTRIEIDSDGD